MRHSLAKMAVRLDIDTAANIVFENLYGNVPGAKRRLARRFQILGYHKVSPDPHPFFEPVHPDVFEKHVQFLSRYYHVMPLSELVERNRRGDIPSGAVAITFDDGYRVPATIFVTTGVIDTGEILWHDRVFDAFRYTTVSRARLEYPGVPELKLESTNDRRRSLSPVLAKAKTLYGEARLRFVEDIEKALRPRLDKSLTHRMLSWSHIREMYAEGIEIGSHTVTHTALSRLPGQEVVKELRESKGELSGRLGMPICLFAYPNGHAGDYNEEVKTAIKDSGYTCALTSRRGFNHVFSDPFDLRRGLPWHTEIELFRFAFFLERHGLS